VSSGTNHTRVVSVDGDTQMMVAKPEDALRYFTGENIKVRLVWLAPAMPTSP